MDPLESLLFSRRQQHSYEHYQQGTGALDVLTHSMLC
jgi:hypothetical protein